MELKFTWNPVPASDEDMDAITAVWENSVLATHWFLPETEVAELKPRVRQQYLPAVDLYKVNKPNGRIVGFMGIVNDKVEMLFVDPIYIGKGVGKAMMSFALHRLGVTKVDVNEQNEEALGFYLSQGFVVKSRSPLDSAGKPYPILHLEQSC